MGFILVRSPEVPATLSMSPSAAVRTQGSSPTAGTAPRALPASLRAAIAGRLGGDGLSQTLADDGGLHVSEASGTPATWSLVPTAVGRAGSKPVPLHGATPVTSTGRTTYAMGGLSAWYHSSASGIEQGFTIAHRPGGAGAPLAIDLQSGGQLVPALTSATTLALDSKSGRAVLTYGALRVTDSQGSAVPASLQLHGRTLKIVIDDRRASYPLVVDPLTQQAELTQPATGSGAGASGDLFGTSVALSASGTTAIVGAPFHSVDGVSDAGAAYVFSGADWGTTTLLTEPLTGPDAAAINDYFGTSVSLSADGTVALVGAPGKTANSQAVEGAAFAFGGTDFGTVAVLTEPTSGPGVGSAGDGFGEAVSLSSSGTDALIGAPKVSGPARPGTAYVFRSSSGAAPVSVLTASDGSGGNYFGGSVAISADGSTAIVGARGQTVGANYSQGAAYVFGGTNWATQEKILTASNGIASDQFGFSVSLSTTGSTALVGAAYASPRSTAEAGAAYVFSGSDWTDETDLSASNGTAYSNYGWSVALSPSGTTALVGAPYEAVGSNTYEGAVYSYGGPGWAVELEGTSADGVPGDLFGYSVAVSADGSETITGAAGHTVASHAGQGSAYLLAPTPEASASLISASPSSIVGDGTSTSTVTVQAVYDNGNDMTTGGATVALASTAGSLGPVTDNGNGTYSAVLTSATTPGSATISGTLNGLPIGNTATVTFTSIPPPPAASSGYWTVAGDGGVFSFGPHFYGSTGNLTLNQPVFAITSTADGKGYWFVARDGGVFSYGDAAFHGSVPTLGVRVADIVGMAADTATGGYWLVGSDGGVYAFGAPFEGSMPALGERMGDIVGMAATSDGGGYYLVSSTGAVYAFGDATYRGGANTVAHLNAPIVGLGVDQATGGYWEAGSDGRVYAYGAPLEGRAGATGLNSPVVGIAASGSGYYLVASDGGVFACHAPFLGSMGGKHLNAPMVGITVAG
jgi:hypothetical protein